jgi:hypothetical protein
VILLNKRLKKKKAKQRGGESMRTLEEIRKKNRRSDLLIVGMESAPISVPRELSENEKALYEDFIKPHVEDFFIKHLEKGRI